MKSLFKSVLFMALGLFLIIGCAMVNKSLDKTSEGAKELGKPMGKVMNVPTAVAEGAAEGVQGEIKDNPFNR